jgi:hypothetical protein
MARTYADVITRARRILKDQDASSYRYPDQDLVDAVNDAVLEVRRIRPDLFIAAAFATTDVLLADIATTNIPIPEHYLQTLVYLTCGYQMLRDDEFSQDSRAVNLMNKGVSQLQRTMA